MRFRRKARENSLLVLYKWDITGEPIEKILRDTIEERKITNEKIIEYMGLLVKTVANKLPEIDTLISDTLENWSLDRLGYIERNILRLATAEIVLLNGEDMGLIFNDYLNIAKRYSDTKASRFIHGILSNIKERSKTTFSNK